MRDMVGNWINGTIPKILLTKMKVKSVKRYGTKRMNSRPITSRPKSFRTNEYTDSPANWSFEGTTAALRDETMKNTEMRRIERKTKRIGFVANSLPSINGGRLKAMNLPQSQSS